MHPSQQGLRRSAWLACLWLAACGAGTAGRQEPAAAESSAPVPPAIEPPAEPARPAAPLGWWRGDDVCLELFANGDFELSLPRREPKILVMGAATLSPAGEDLELRLATSRIWKGRFTGPCRKIHELGDWMDSQVVLGVSFKPGETSTLKIKRAGDARIELCGENCVTLQQATPHLGARWRRGKLTYPDRPEEPFAAGDLLELELADDSTAHLWAGLAGGEHGTAYGKTAVKYLAPDRFAVTFTAEWFADLPAGTTPQALGLTFGAGEARTLDVRRLAGERIEVCAADRCATLERQFDAYHHDLD